MQTRKGWQTVLFLLGWIPAAAWSQPVPRFGSEFPVNSGTSRDQLHSSAAMDGSSNFVVVWEDHRDPNSIAIFGKRYDAGANDLSGDFQIDTSTPTYNYFPAVARSQTSGRFVVVWQTGVNGNFGSGYIVAQLYDAAGSPVGSEMTVSQFPAAQHHPAVAMDNSGNFVVVWEQYSTAPPPARGGVGYQISGRRFNSGGAALGGDFRINTFTTSFDGLQPSVSVNPGTGDFVVVWTDIDGRDGALNGIFARRYQSDGADQGLPFQVNTAGTLNQNYPSVAVNGAGDFMVVWADEYRNHDIRGQRFGSGGGKLGDEFTVNTDGSDYQVFPAAAASSGSGRFVVTWDSPNQPGDDQVAVRGQQFDSDGSRLGGELQVNTYTTNLQQDSTVAMDSAGGFLVAWTSQCPPPVRSGGPRGCLGQDGSGAGVFAQLYRNPTSPTATATATVTATATATPTATATASPSATRSATPSATATPPTMAALGEGAAPLRWLLLALGAAIGLWPLASRGRRRT
jgi:hypothetical protein